MYKATPITKRAGSPLHNDLVDNHARNLEKGKDTQAYKKISESISPGTPGEKGKEITKTEIKPPTRTEEGDKAYAALDQAGKDAQDDKRQPRRVVGYSDRQIKRSRRADNNCRDGFDRRGYRIRDDASDN